MHDTALRRIAALVIAALLAMLGAALTTAVFASDALAIYSGGNTGNAQNISPDDGGEDLFGIFGDHGDDDAVQQAAAAS